MEFVNLPKFVLSLVTIICMTILIGTRTLDAGIGIPVITGILGIGIGNGIALKNGDPVEPMIGTRQGPANEPVPPPAR